MFLLYCFMAWAADEAGCVTKSGKIRNSYTQSSILGSFLYCKVSGTYLLLTLYIRKL